MISSIDALRIEQFTHLHDAMIHGIRSFQKMDLSAQQTHQNVLMIFTDGQEYGSSSLFGDVEEILKNPNVPNFRFMLVMAGSDGSENFQLVQLCKSNACKAYCTVVPVEDSKNGVKKGYEIVECNVQLLKNPTTSDLQNVIKLDMRFGSTEITADVGHKQSVKIQFLAERV
ncbi:hypothetical protein BC936DRAFT_142167 [Jimgerdemannia flammicorona]|uniref:VWFA domain-containing protein n=1 Tax=Jimgerdemannia flammicorona TaxID=994334 RepID=A0A433A190_9FUNG|nr:hypothetical protein BC936DRAFT_142167 [Jimgerdemannia flammicorona]